MTDKLEDPKADVKKVDTPPASPDSPNGKVTEPLSDAQIEQILSHPKLLESLGPEVAEAAKRKAQSIADKTTHDVKQDVDAILDNFKTLVAEGWSEAQAKRLMNMERPAPASEVSQGSETKQLDLNFNNVFEAAGIDPNSAEALELAKGAGSDAAKLLSAILSREIDPEPEASPGGVVIPASGGSPDENPIAEINSPEELFDMHWKTSKS